MLGPEEIKTKISGIMEIESKQQGKSVPGSSLEKAGAQSGLPINVMFQGADDGFVIHRS